MQTIYLYNNIIDLEAIEVNNITITLHSRKNIEDFNIYIRELKKFDFYLKSDYNFCKFNGFLISCSQPSISENLFIYEISYNYYKVCDKKDPEFLKFIRTIKLKLLLGKV